MKIRVKKRFHDRENDMALRLPGDGLDVPDGRGAELIAKGFADEVKPERTTEKKS